MMVETRATGIVSVVNIDTGKTSDYGNVVSPGALAQNHQHIFCVRMDPAIDGHDNTVVQEESHRAPMNPKTNLRISSRRIPRLMCLRIRILLRSWLEPGVVVRKIQKFRFILDLVVLVE